MTSKDLCPKPPQLKPFVREATGLVRELSIWDSFFMNISNNAPALALLTYTTASYLFPGGDPITATFLAVFFSIFVSIMYTLLTWAMPRSGGDYIFMSRIIHPAVGFVGNFNLNFWYMFYIGITANWVTTFALSPSIMIAGTLSGNQSLVSLANTLAQPQYVILIGAAILIFYTLLMVKGVRSVFRVNDILVAISLVGLLGMAWLLLSNSNASFIAAFSRFADYNAIIAAAHAAGYSTSGPNPLVATMGLMPFVYTSTGFGIITAYFAGEVKSVKKNVLYSQVGSVLVVGAFLASLGYLAIHVFGYDFLGSITSLSFAGSSQYPFSVPPTFNLFVAMLAPNAGTMWLLGVALVTGSLIVLPTVSMIATRSVFAWSFDRVVPSAFSRVDERTHTPVTAIVLVGAIEIMGLIAYTYFSPTFLALASGAAMLEIFTFMVVSIAAIILPFTKKEFYEATPANIKFAGIPIITIAGAVSFIFYAVMQYFYLTNPLYGANIPIVWEGGAVSVVLPIVIFAVSYYYRKSQGLDLSLAFKQIPPE
ncbi:MAG: APC family permease [Candidatus Bathyarchaeia archaeon]